MAKHKRHERKREIHRRRHRRKKLRKLRERLRRTDDPQERATVIQKIRKVSPDAPLEINQGEASE